MYHIFSLPSSLSSFIYYNRFGFKGKGDYKFLTDYLKDTPINVISYDVYKNSDKIIKSSLIRKMILNNKFL